MESENVIYFQKRVTSFTHSRGIKNWKLEIRNRNRKHCGHKKKSNLELDCFTSFAMTSAALYCGRKKGRLRRPFFLPYITHEIVIPMEERLRNLIKYTLVL